MGIQILDFVFFFVDGKRPVAIFQKATKDGVQRVEVVDRIQPNGTRRFQNRRALQLQMRIGDCRSVVVVHHKGFQGGHDAIEVLHFGAVVLVQKALEILGDRVRAVRLAPLIHCLLKARDVPRQGAREKVNMEMYERLVKYKKECKTTCVFWRYPADPHLGACVRT